MWREWKKRAEVKATSLERFVWERTLYSLIYLEPYEYVLVTNIVEVWLETGYKLG